METRVVLERYAKYYNYLQILGQIKLDVTPTIQDLGLSKGAIQSGYKEISEMNFKGNLIDYLCYISTLHVVITTKKFLPEDVNFGRACQYVVKDMYRHSTFDVNNLLRLVVRNPKYLYNLFGDVSVTNDVITQKLSGFDALFELWLFKYLSEEISPEQ